MAGGALKLAGPPVLVQADSDDDADGGAKLPLGRHRQPQLHGHGHIEIKGRVTKAADQTHLIESQIAHIDVKRPLGA